MSYAIAIPRNNLMSGERAVSKTSFSLNESLNLALSSLQQSICLGWKSSLKTELMSLFAECSESGWDGYDATPIHKNTAASAFVFINYIPDGVLAPELSASPDGGVTFEWINERNILSVTIYEDLIVYAQLIDESKKHGEIGFSSEFPDEISTSLKYFQI